MSNVKVKTGRQTSGGQEFFRGDGARKETRRVAQELAQKLTQFGVKNVEIVEQGKNRPSVQIRGAYVRGQSPSSVARSVL